MIAHAIDTGTGREPEPDPFAIIVDHPAGFAFRVEILITRRQQLLLRFLTRYAGSAVPERVLRLFGEALPEEPAAVALAEEISQLAEQLAIAVGCDVLRRLPDSYLLETEPVRIAIPEA